MKTTEEKEIKEDLRWKLYSFDFYKDPDDKEKWLKCPECGLTPRIWVFDNGRNAHCICGSGQYDHKHQVKATPIIESVKKTGGSSLYDSDELRKNWNKYIKNLK